MRLQELGECVNNLSHEAQNLQNSFNLCLHDFLESKIEETKRKSQNIEKLLNNSSSENEMKEKSSNISNLKRMSQLPLSHKIQKENKEYEKDDVKLEFESKKECLLSNIKRISPDYSSLLDMNKFLPMDYSPISTPLPKKMPRTKKVLYNNKYYESIFSRLSKKEKGRIFYDKTLMGSSELERKWGINHRTLISFDKSMHHIFHTEDDKIEWLDKMKERIDEKVNKMSIENITKCIEYTLDKINSISETKTSLSEVCSLAFDRGIAIAGARYKINLLELEYLLQNMYKEDWREMEKNKWFNVGGKKIFSNLGNAEKLEIAKLSEEEGVLYISKRCGISKDTIRIYRKLLFQRRLKVELPNAS